MRIDSRKSRVRRLAVLLLVCLAAAVPAQLQHETIIQPGRDYLAVSLTAAGADVDELFENLQNGMTVRMEYRIRVSVPRRRPFALLGDRLVREFRPTAEARWDPFLSAFTLTAADGQTKSYTTEATLYARLFALEDYRIPWTAVGRSDSIVLETSVEYTPIVFVPGLRILSLFTANRNQVSPWSRDAVQVPLELP